MLSYLSLIVLLLLFWRLATWALTWRRNVAFAKASGIPYVIGPVCVTEGYLWLALAPLILPLISWVYPKARDALWWKVSNPKHAWAYPREINDAIGSDIFIIASPQSLCLNTSDPSVTMQIATRYGDFEKPIETYAVMDMYGSSILTTEGQNWKRHKRIVRPAFNEKSNTMVWEESLRQAEGMLHSWARLPGNTSKEMKVGDTAKHMLKAALNVISGAGFGVRQLWEDQDECMLGKHVVSGFNTQKLLGKHQMSFLSALESMSHSVIWMALFPLSVLKASPFKIHKEVMQGFYEVGDYFAELANLKLRQIETGDVDEGTMDLMGPLVKATQSNPDKDNEGSEYMTPQEVTANSWVFLFAGHETSANTLHFSLLFLACDLRAQRKLQSDIDSIAQDRPSHEWTYATDMRRFYNSMVGAIQNETLRLMPPVIQVPKSVRGKQQTLIWEGNECTLPPRTHVYLDVINSQRNPKHYPHKKTPTANKPNDMHDFVPSRWFIGQAEAHRQALNDKSANPDFESPKLATFESHETLYSPPKGAFIAFSEGPRGSPGRRFAQVEMTAVIAAIFANYTIELDVSHWASDEAVMTMSAEQKRLVYEKATLRARKLMRESENVTTLKMMGEAVPVRVLRRGEERFACCA